MLALDDPRWLQMKSGYRLPYDARPLLKRFAEGRKPDACWDELWTELHHQGDVDTASYAVVPHLVEAARGQKRDWNLYGYAAIVHVEAGQRQNPPVPDFLVAGLDRAFAELFELAVADLRSGASPMTVRCLLQFLAAYARTPELSRAIGDVDLFEAYGERVLEAERNGRN